MVAVLFVASRGSRGPIIIVSVCLCRPGAGAAAEFGPVVIRPRSPSSTTEPEPPRCGRAGGREGGADAGRVVSQYLPVRTINTHKRPKSGPDERYQPPATDAGSDSITQKSTNTFRTHNHPPPFLSTSNSKDFHLTRRGKEARGVRDGNKVMIMT